MLLNRIISKHAYLLSGSKRKVRCLLVHRNYNNSYSATLASTFSTSSENSGDNSEDVDNSGEEGNRSHEESYEEREIKSYKKGYRERTSLPFGTQLEDARRDGFPKIVLEPRLDLEVYRYPNMHRHIELENDDDDELEEMEGDIDDVNDESYIRNPFDWTKLKRHYVAYIGHLPNSVTEESLRKHLFDPYINGTVHLEIVKGKERNGGRRRKGYRYRRKDGSKPKFQAYAYAYFENAGNLRTAIHVLNGKPFGKIGKWGNPIPSKKLFVGLSKKHHQNPDAKANLAVTGGELFYDKDGRLHVDAGNKMKKIDTITSEERAFFFPKEKKSNLKMVASRMNLPPRPKMIEEDDLVTFVDNVYTVGEAILSEHSDPASYMTTQEKNLYGISHNWNPVLRASDEQKQIIQARKLRDMEAALGLSEMEDTDGSSEDLSHSNADDSKTKNKKAHLGVDVGEFTNEQAHLRQLENFSSIVLSTGRVAVTRKAGRDASFRCLVVAGDCMGRGGFGFGKGDSVMTAREQALKDAVKNMVYIPLYEGRTLYHDLNGKHNNAKVILKARPAGSGLVAGPAVRSILDVIGIRDCTTKVFGRQNIYSTVQAVFNAFNSYEDAESVALKRGKRLVDVNDIMRGSHQSIW